MTLTQTRPVPLTTRRILQTWWPLAASWLLMGIELPAISAIMARLPAPEINLAAYGGIVFPIALIIEAPIIMLLAASTALSKDWDSYVKLRRFMWRSGAILTILHLLIALTPLYYVVTRTIIGAPEAIIEPARIGLIIMTPWTWSIAYRRFQQGVLIRFGHSRAVGVGTVIRLAANFTVLAVGYSMQTVPGIVVATLAVIAGVLSEALYAGLRVRPVVRNQVILAPACEEPLTFPSFVSFYLPLVLTSLLHMLVQPIGSAALSRMPDAIESLAVWPVVAGLVFMFRSAGMAFNEVVVALLDEPEGHRHLRQFAVYLSLILSALLIIATATPLASLWYNEVAALSPPLADLARTAMWFFIPLPAFQVLQSWYQGALVNGRQTRGISEAIAIYLIVTTILLQLGVQWSPYTGLYIAGVAFSIALLAQTAWLWYRSRPVMKATARHTIAPMPPVEMPVP